MRHFDPDDPIWTEDEDRAAARHESYEDWQSEVDAEGVNLAVDHRTAQHLVDLLEQDGEVPVSADDWQVL